MNLFMTFSTSRQNIQPMRWFVALVMMILFGLYGAVMAFKTRCFLNLAITNSMFYSLSCFVLFGMSNGIAQYSFEVSNFVFLSLAIYLSCSFTLFCLVIFIDPFQAAYFAIRTMSIFSFIVFVKLRKLFDLLAFRTKFCLNYLSHGLFLYKRLRLEPLAEPISVGGSLYSILENE